MALKINLPADAVPANVAGVIDGIVPVHFSDQGGSWSLKIGTGIHAWVHSAPGGMRNSAAVRSFLYLAVACYRNAMRARAGTLQST